MTVSKYRSPSLRKITEITRSLPTGEEATKAWQEVDEGSDRVSALLATAWLDLQIEAALKGCFSKQLGSDFKAYFGAQGSLSTFAAKCDMAYALDIFGPITLAALKQIAKVRNVFAHAPSIVSFETPELEVVCRELRRVPKSYKLCPHLEFTEYVETEGSPRENFVEASGLIFVSLLRREIQNRLSDLRVLKLHLQEVQQRVNALGVALSATETEPAKAAPKLPSPFMP